MSLFSWLMAARRVLENDRITSEKSRFTGCWTLHSRLEGPAQTGAKSRCGMLVSSVVPSANNPQCLPMGGT